MRVLITGSARRYLLLTAVSVAAALSLPAFAWQLVHDSGGVRVERRDYAGSALQEIRGTTRVRATLNAVMALLKDAPVNARWVYRSGGARILEENGYHQAYVYGVVDAPWPMSDRDTVVRFDYQQDPQTRAIRIDIINFPDFIPSREGFVRVPEFGGFWQLRPEVGGWLEVTYQVYGDPGGLIPVWLANQAAAVSVTRTLLNLEAAVKPYADAHSPYVQELPSR